NVAPGIYPHLVAKIVLVGRVLGRYAPFVAVYQAAYPTQVSNRVRGCTNLWQRRIIPINGIVGTMNAVYAGKFYAVYIPLYIKERKMYFARLSDQRDAGVIACSIGRHFITLPIQPIPENGIVAHRNGAAEQAVSGLIKQAVFIYIDGNLVCSGRRACKSKVGAQRVRSGLSRSTFNTLKNNVADRWGGRIG